VGQIKKVEGDPEVKHEPKCFNCNMMGHIAAKCQMPKREKDACFKCYQLGHKSKDCPAKEPKTDNLKDAGKKKNDVNGVFEEDENFRRDILYQLCDDKGQSKEESTLNTLLDTGSPVSFIKENFIPNNLVVSVLPGDNNYSGLNGSTLKAKGRVTVKVAFNNKKTKFVSLLVVPVTSMTAAVVIGRDILRQFYDKETLSVEENEDQVIREILNIDVDFSKQKIEDSLNINPELTIETKTILKTLYVENYVKPIRPDISVTDAELKLTLKEEKPFHFNPRRLSHMEKNALRVLLDSLLEKAIIRPSESEYASPIVLVRKKNRRYKIMYRFPRIE